jgi:hypothetical protein
MVSKRNNPMPGRGALRQLPIPKAKTVTMSIKGITSCRMRNMASPE